MNEKEEWGGGGELREHLPQKAFKHSYRSETNSTKYNERVLVFMVETRAPATVVRELGSACHAIFTD